jgi:hypothetical protein
MIVDAYDLSEAIMKWQGRHLYTFTLIKAIAFPQR